MARIGSAPVASRYDGLQVGAHFAYSFEAQDGVPVDGGRQDLRDRSPMTFRIVPPDVLLSFGQGSSTDLLQAASLGYNQSQVRSALAKVTVTGVGSNPSGQVQAFVSAGKVSRGGVNEFSPSLADALTAADIGLQVQKALDAPPLTLFVNPSEMSIQFTKVQSYQSVTRYGYVFESWGEDQPSMSCSGSTGGFYAGAVGELDVRAFRSKFVSGLLGVSKVDSAAWQNFTSLVHFYKNNGYIYDTINKTESSLMVGHVAISYDQWVYLGHFESFSYSYNEAMPHRVEYSFEFKVSRMYDTTAPTSTSSVQSTSSEVQTAEVPLDLLGVG
jgi:hypothetical protein